MQELDDNSLLKQYAEQDSEGAFAALVSRHINKVYSVALRHTRNPGQAEEITQAVFVILAKKADSLSKQVVLSGWLYQTARLASITFLRGEIRRARREQEAHMQNVVNEASDETWNQIAPLLDSAIAALNETDRHAVVLRFFDGKSMCEIGAAIGATEDTAKKRVGRALEKLRTFFARRGVHSTTAIIAQTISVNSVQIAPAALAKSVTAIALAKGATASSSTLTLFKGALKIMAWTKATTAIVAGTAIVLAIGTTTAIVKQEVSSKEQLVYESIFKHPDGSSAQRLEACPPVLVIRPTHYPNVSSGIWTTSGKGVYVNADITDLISWAYNFDPLREILPGDISHGGFDYLNTMPKPTDALHKAITKQFGLTAQSEVRATDVLLLKVKDEDRLNAFRTTGKPFACYGTGYGDTQFRYFTNAPLSLLTQQIVEGYFRKPCIDSTRIKGNYDFMIQWDEPKGLTGQSRWNALQPVIEQQLNSFGLELVPTNMPIQMLVVDKAE